MTEGREFLIARTALLVALPSGDLLIIEAAAWRGSIRAMRNQPMPALCRLDMHVAKACAGDCFNSQRAASPDP